MPNHNHVDNSKDNLDNSANNVGNDEYHEVIRQEDLKRLYDPNCQHEFVRDDSDTIGDSVAWVCRECGRGTFLPKTAKII